MHMAWHCLQPANSQLGSYLPCLALKKRKASWEKQGGSGPWLRESSPWLGPGRSLGSGSLQELSMVAY